MADLGKGYVQIVPSAKGIKGSITNVLNNEAAESGKNAGDTIADKIKAAIKAAGIGMILKETLFAGADLEQSIGGIETLYKDSADKMKQYAADAYKTAGVSANQYMEMSTSFAAGLVKSLGGNTDAAAEAANTAIIDMSDNANKMGTSMESIQMAYQGFAKQNYTMLDNLKLGYGGTKTEMERLLKDAQEISGVEYNIDNLADVYDAIHVIQGKLGVTGTTAKESASTFSGSMASMKAAAQNLMGQIALGMDIGPALNALADTAITFLVGNLIPSLLNIFTALPGAIFNILTVSLPTALETFFMNTDSEVMQKLQTSVTNAITTIQTGITEGIPMLFAMIQSVLTSIHQWVIADMPALLTRGVEMISNLANGMFSAIPEVLSSIGQILSELLATIQDALPSLLDNGIQLVTNMATGMLENLPAVLEAIGQIIAKLITFLLNNMPVIFQKGWELIQNLAQGIWNNLPAILSAIGNVLSSLLSALISSLPQFLAKGRELLGKIAEGIRNAVGTVLGAIGSVISQMISKAGSFVGQMVSAGFNLLMGLGQGIRNAVGNVISQLMGSLKSIVQSALDFLGIASPSKVFAEMGEFMDLGLAEGITGNISAVDSAMDNLLENTTDSFQADLTASAKYTPNAIGTGNTSTTNYGGVSINITASDFGSAEEIFEYIRDRLTSETIRQEAVFA